MNFRTKQTMPFKKGDIIIKTDAVYPHGALAVDGYDEQGRLLAHPKGGGLQYVFNTGTDRQFRLVATDEQREVLWRISRFSLEGVEGIFKGWTNGQLWNGWEMPHFELEEAQRLAVALNEPKVHYDAAQSVFINSNPGEEDETWFAKMITASGPNQVKVYAIGAGSWCWEEVSNGQR